MKQLFRTFNAGTPLAHKVLLVLAFSMPVYKPAAAGLIILLFLVCIPFRHFRWGHYWWPCFFIAMIYVLHLTGMRLTQHSYEAWKELEYKASYLAFPLIALVLPNINLRMRSQLLKAFTLGVVVFMIYALGRACLFWYVQGDTAYFGYESLSHPFHPSYLAMYACVSVGWLMLEEDEMKPVWLNRMLLLVLILFISLLASKAGLLSAMLLLCATAWVRFRKTGRIGPSVLWPAIGMALLIVTSVCMPVTAGRLAAAARDVSQQQSQVHAVAYSSNDVRMVVWSSAWQLIKEHPMGVGTGNTTPELVKIYRARGETYAAEKNLNAHNQFLQVACEHGWPALLFLVLACMLWLQQVWRNKDMMGALVPAMAVFNFCFESLLERQEGIVFFCFWLMVAVRSSSSHASVSKVTT